MTLATELLPPKLGVGPPYSYRPRPRARIRSAHARSPATTAGLPRHKSPRPGLNWSPRPYQGRALPSELRGPTLVILNPYGQGRIRTSVARKERQIYSLLPLTTRPPVRLQSLRVGPPLLYGALQLRSTGLAFAPLISRIVSALPVNSPTPELAAGCRDLKELAEGLEPPTC